MEVNPLVAFSFYAGTPIALLYYGKKKLVETGFAILEKDKMIVTLNGTTHDFHFDDIKSYMIDRYNGIRFMIENTDGRKLTIRAHENICPPRTLYSLSKRFEGRFKRYRATTGNEQYLIKPPFLQSKKAQYLIYTSAIVLVGMAIHSYMNGRKLPLVFYMSVGILLSMWAAYRLARRERKTERG
jgi:hypothetical protein